MCAWERVRQRGNKPSKALQFIFMYSCLHHFSIDDDDRTHFLLNCSFFHAISHTNNITTVSLASQLKSFYLFRLFENLGKAIQIRREWREREKNKIIQEALNFASNKKRRVCTIYSNVMNNEKWNCVSICGNQFERLFWLCLTFVWPLVFGQLLLPATWSFLCCFLSLFVIFVTVISLRARALKCVNCL